MANPNIDPDGSEIDVMVDKQHSAYSLASRIESAAAQNRGPASHKLETYLKCLQEGLTRKEQVVEIARLEKRLNSLGYLRGKMGVRVNGKPTLVRQLVLSTGVESTTLTQTAMAATVLEGAQPARCFREALWTRPMAAKTETIPKGQAGTYADEIAEGAQVPEYHQDYGSVTLTAKKYGTRPAITEDMLEDALYDVAAMEVRYGGARIENTINQVVLTGLLDAANTLEHDTSGSNQGLKAVGKAKSLVRGAGWGPNTLVMCADAEAKINDDFIPSSYVGAAEVMAGKLPPMLGLRAFNCDVEDASATYTWDYDSDSDIGMLVFDSMKAGVLGIRRDIRVEKFRDVIADVTHAVLTSRFGFASIWSTACARIEY
jgi:hypothetical protein